jgi:cation-transporting ATPase E
METVPRGPADAAAGLTAVEVEERRAAGLTNDVEDPTSRSLADIVRGNVLTPFNLLLGILLVVILAVREYRDALFGFVLVANAAIGIVQELRAKRSLDRLAVLNAPTALVRRAGTTTEIPSRELVRDDVIELRLGDQIAVDGEVLEESGLEIDESLLTGEAEPVAKDAGDDVRSGSFVVAGSGAIQATAVGADAYAFKLSSEAKRFSLVRSELRTGINRVITWIGWLMIPTAVLLVTAQLSSDIGVVEAVQGSVAGLVAMVPEGLVLLTSIAFAVGATRLARKQVLTQELAAIEGLARVDVICLDKTGTLTEGALTLGTLDVLGRSRDGRADPADVLAALGGSEDHPNPSLAAIAAAYDRTPGWRSTGSVAFSSARKWSAAAFDGQGTWFLGAPDILLTRAEGSDVLGEATARLDGYARDGRRVLMLAASPSGLDGDRLPDALDPVALVVLDERLRESATGTIAYFGEQGVTVKIISGDSPVTVRAVAERVGVPGASDAVDARTLPDDPEELAEVLESHSVFGRVTPQQKRSMVHALQSRGHTVAMTGDGVNDTLALKDADIGVAMGTGSPAARAVARFVLLANDFSVFPSVVAEGRRVIANVERVANLFLTKTFYAVVLAMATGLFRIPFPFLPRHFTIISAITIGIPGFFLALAPNVRLARPGFLERVLRFAIPAGVVAGIATFGAYLVARGGSDADLDEARTVAVLVLFTIALWVLAYLSRPLLTWRGVLVLAMVGLFAGACAIVWTRDYFALVLPDAGGVLAAVGVGAAAGALLQVGWHLSGWAPPPATSTPTPTPTPTDDV